MNNNCKGFHTQILILKTLSFRSIKRKITKFNTNSKGKHFAKLIFTNYKNKVANKTQYYSHKFTKVEDKIMGPRFTIKLKKKKNSDSHKIHNSQQYIQNESNI